MSLLFEFTQYSAPGLGQSGSVLQQWRFTDAEQPVPLGDSVFEPAVGIKPDDFEVSSENISGSVNIQVPLDFPVASLYLKGHPARPVFVRIINSETGHTGYKGRILYAAWNEKAATLNTTGASALLRREGLRIRYQGPCGWALYSNRCGVNRADHLVTGTLDAEPSPDGRTLTSSAFAGKPDGWFVAGDFECAGQSRTIIAHAGNSITLLASIEDLAIGMSFEASEGCDRSAGATGCAKFNNIDNFGGCKNVPAKNPFEGL